MMDIFIEVIIDFITTIFIENTDNIIENKKISKWIRYPIIFIAILLSLILTVGLIVLGIFILNESIIASIISMIVGLLILMGIVFRVKKVIKEKSE